MVQKPESGADMVTTVWALQMVATLAGACIVGVVADKNPSIYIWICLPFAAQIVLPVAAGWLGEERTTSGFRKAKLVENGHFFFIGSVMAAGALGLGAASLWGSTVVQAAYSMTIGVVLCALSLWLLPPMLGTLESSARQRGGVVTARGAGCRVSAAALRSRTEADHVTFPFTAFAHVSVFSCCLPPHL